MYVSRVSSNVESTFLGKRLHCTVRSPELFLHETSDLKSSLNFGVLVSPSLVDSSVNKQKEEQTKSYICSIDLRRRETGTNKKTGEKNHKTHLSLACLKIFRNKKLLYLISSPETLQNGLFH